MSDRKILQEYHNTTIQDYALNIIYTRNQKNLHARIYMFVTKVSTIIYITLIFKTGKLN